jgi:HAD superfamily hydrolase (TIGR01549 family)
LIGQIQGAIFDMDGTLGDTVYVSVEAIIRTVFHLTGKTYTHPEIIDRFGPTEFGILQTLIPEELWQESYQIFLREYDSIHRKYKIKAYPGIQGVLDLLNRHNIRKAIVTGKSRESAEISLQYFNLETHFDAVETGSDFGSIKKDCIHKVVKIWKFPPENVLYIGDAPSDVSIAKSAGVCPVSVAWANTADRSRLALEQPCFIFERVEHFQTWLATHLDGSH